MKGSGISLVVMLLAIFGLQSCSDPNLVFEENRSIKGSGWAVSDTVVLRFDIQDTLSQHNFLLNVRNTNDYPYRNLYVFVKTVFPNGKFSRDTVGVVLADPSGRWLGSGSGFLFTNQSLTNKIMYKYGRRFPLSGTYRVELEQAMRTDTLPGISSVGLRIEKTTPPAGTSN